MENNRIEQVKERIREELGICMPSETPVICAAISTPEGRERMEQLILERVIESKSTIRDAIIAIDTEFDQNSLD